MKIICVGRNFTAHARELDNPIPETPLIFMKPPSALLVNDKPFYYPNFSRDIHYEAELVVKICKNGRHVEPEFAHRYYREATVGIDLTARDIQKKLKEKGHPWEIAKGFDGSAVLGRLVDISSLKSSGIQFHLDKNGERAQSGHTRDMIFSIDEIIAYISKFFRLQMGDLIYTGTPSGVGPVQIGDRLEGFLEDERVVRLDIR